MFWNLVKKDILLNLVTFRFIATYVAAILLVTIGSLVLVKEYEYKRENQFINIEENRRELEKAETYIHLIPYLQRVPTPLSSLSKGVDDLFGNRIAIPGIYSQVSVFADNTASNPFLATILSFDLAHVIAMVVTLLALFLAFNAISGETESGTMRLLLSYSTPKYQVLLAKYLSIFACVSVSVLSAFLVWLLVLLFNEVALSLSDGIRIIICFLISLLLVSFFILLGLLVSCLSKRSSTSLMILIFLWVLLVVVIPNFNSWSITTTYPITKKSQPLTQEEIRRRIREAEPPLEPEEGTSYGSTTTFYFPPDKLTYNLIKEGSWDPILHNLMIEQYGLYTVLTRFSPIEAYLLASSGLARTSVDTHLDFLQKSLEYQKIIGDWQRAKLKVYPHRSSRITDRDSKLDKGDFPQILPFAGDEDLTNSFSSISLDLLILVLYNLLFFVSAYVSFNRYQL